MDAESKMTPLVDKMAQITEDLKDGVMEMFTSGRYAEYLKTMSKFHTYSWRNAVLIHRQNPQARYVASFGAWKSMDRSIKEGEHGIQIIAPVPYKQTITVTQDEKGKPLAEPIKKEVERLSFRPAFVFDVSQTFGRELPKLITQLSGQVAECDRMIDALKQISPCQISFGDLTGLRANGVFLPERNEIVIQDGLSQGQTVKTMIHEIAHAKLGHGKNFDRQVGEIHAESVAYITCQHFGIDSTEYSFGYVASWSAGKKLAELQDCLQGIQKEAKDIVENLNRKLSLEKVQERKPTVRDKLQQAEKNCKERVADVQQKEQSHNKKGMER